MPVDCLTIWYLIEKPLEIALLAKNAKPYYIYIKIYVEYVKKQ